MADRFYPAIPEQDVVEGEACAVVVNDWPILLARYEGLVHAVVDICSHANASLIGGRLRRGSVTCPLHGARFDVRTGACAGKAYLPLKIFATRISDSGWIEVEVPGEAPGIRFISAAPRD